MIEAVNNTFNSSKNLKILNFYSENCPPCHAFMPNFIEAEKTFGNYFDFVIVDVGANMDLAGKFGIMGTPTIIILASDKVAFNKSGVPNGLELKKVMLDLIGIDSIPKNKIDKPKRNKIFAIF